MKKITLILLFAFFIMALTSTHTASSFSIQKPVSSEMLQYIYGKEFIKLSFSEYVKITGERPNLFNRFAFNTLKQKIKHDLKKDPDLRLTSYAEPKKKMSTWLKILLWVAGIFLLLVAVIAIIFGGTQR